MSAVARFVTCAFLRVVGVDPVAEIVQQPEKLGEFLGVAEHLDPSEFHRCEPVF